MKQNKIYKSEMQAARRLREWVDGHKSLVTIFLATEAVICVILAIIS